MNKYQAYKTAAELITLLREVISKPELLDAAGKSFAMTEDERRRRDEALEIIAQASGKEQELAGREAKVSAGEQRTLKESAELSAREQALADGHRELDERRARLTDALAAKGAQMEAARAASEKGLEGREKLLLGWEERKKKELAAAAEAMKARSRQIDARTPQLDEREKALAAREAELDARQAALAEQEGKVRAATAILTGAA